MDSLLLSGRLNVLGPDWIQDLSSEMYENRGTTISPNGAFRYPRGFVPLGSHSSQRASRHRNRLLRPFA
jgi:hypothetical protein